MVLPSFGSFQKLLIVKFSHERLGNEAIVLPGPFFLCAQNAIQKFAVKTLRLSFIFRGVADFIFKVKINSFYTKKKL